jgi:hypothetical protein
MITCYGNRNHAVGEIRTREQTINVWYRYSLFLLVISTYEWSAATWPRYRNIRMKKWTCWCAGTGGCTSKQVSGATTDMLLLHNDVYSASRWRAQCYCFTNVKYVYMRRQMRPDGMDQCDEVWIFRQSMKISCGNYVAHIYNILPFWVHFSCLKAA